MKIKKVEKHVANLRDKKKMKSLKLALNHGLVSKKVHRVIKFNQESGLKPCIEMKTEVRKKSKMLFRKCFF